ncbi:MAG: chemotaxis protein CheW [Myxococcaceae bacterium]|nr:chemotaxis protein CheW [Myxococcaceae bacterium]
MTDAVKGHLVFACGESLYAVPAEYAVEVVTVPALTRVPGASGYLQGVFAHRGEVIAVVDLQGLLGRAAAQKAKHSRAVLVRVAKGCVALTATRVLGVTHVKEGGESLGASGASAHFKGPSPSALGQVALVEPMGLFDFLSQGA